MTTAAVIQARITSTRLPGKVMLPLAGEPAIFRIIERLRRIAAIDRICVSVPDGGAQNPLAAYVENLGDITLARGPEEDILKRLALAATATGAGTVCRFWGDCPAIDPAVCDRLIDVYRRDGLQFASIPDKSGYPGGYEFEIVDAGCLRAVDAEIADVEARHFFHGIFIDRPERFRQFHLRHQPYLSHLRLLLDTPGDYRRLGRIFSILYLENPIFGLAEVTALAGREPALFVSDA
ncbi:MAG TPA: NTP transferase domain-containing protein [Rhodospirillales bacterium]